MKIKELADMNNLTLADLAKGLGKTKQAVYEMVEKEDVNTAILKQLSAKYRVPIAFFFGGSDDDSSLIKEKLTQLEQENARLHLELQRIRQGHVSPTKVVVELEVTQDEFIKMGLKDKIIQVLNK